MRALRRGTELEQRRRGLDLDVLLLRPHQLQGRLTRHLRGPFCDDDARASLHANQIGHS